MSLDPVRALPPGADDEGQERERQLVLALVDGALACDEPEVFHQPRYRKVALWVFQRRMRRLGHSLTELDREPWGREVVNDLANAGPPPSTTSYRELLQAVKTDARRREALLAMQEAARALMEGGPTPLGAVQLQGYGGVETERPITWLWYPYLPRGEVTVLAGAGGTGKSNLCRHLATLVTAGCDLEGSTGTSEDWLPDRQAERVDVVFNEDSVDKVVWPMLRKAGARLDLVRLVTRGEGQFTAEYVSELIEQYEQEGPPGLLILDPASSLIPAGIDANAQSDVKRSITGPLAALAKRWDVTVVLVMHLKKGSRSSGTTPAECVHGSIEWTAGARSVLTVTRNLRDPDDELVYVFHAKSNLGPLGPTWSYKMVGFGGGPPKVQIMGQAYVSWSDVVGRPSRSSGSLAPAQLCADRLAELLADAPEDGLVAAEVKAQLAQEGFSADAMRRAREQLGVVAERDPQRPSRFVWRAGSVSP